MIGYMKSLRDSKYMSFVVKNKHLLNKYNSIRIKKSNLMKKEFENSPVCEKNILELK